MRRAKAQRPVGALPTLAALGAAAMAVAIFALVPATAQDAAPPRTQDAAWHNEQQAALARLRPEDGWRTLDGGLRIRRIAGDGIGPRPTVEDRVTIHYAGTLTDGTTFDSSWDRGEPATFPLGRLIPAWQMAVPRMAVGDTIEIAVPADLAYGPQGKRTIPGNATLLFTIELIAIEGR
ncbi:FKBP-type peptidyl-prolyl cis-trans isomerase [Altererythrobacter marinus]|jgi:FKBP-type peptidyl-prolyl cis-trans isomerase|uniref:Peptidyl-prolyl cis-trans isomerase n=1 Tax=Pelagerythrobacter marinus TaxID=538382 RepID=A0ABW9UWE9_9SPHN|nr:FKBP-type peptidyl-prolyl cis-trans isomerase [Pelagerythrobacter marinus]MEC9068222.1 FKBP-type peptidyl-prolyl cis-trans isomerase [Pseudomonadota bacterium]MXO68935.1 FKBP-type peptidyl-prolyl cis-trans isomerase [Pelagerythrobacter marinus]